MIDTHTHMDHRRRNREERMRSPDKEGETSENALGAVRDGVCFVSDVLHCVAVVYCSVLQCVAVCCSVLQCVALHIELGTIRAVVCFVSDVLQCVAVLCCSVLQGFAGHIERRAGVCFVSDVLYLCCSVLQCVAAHIERDARRVGG